MSKSRLTLVGIGFVVILGAIMVLNSPATAGGPQAPGSDKSQGRIIPRDRFQLDVLVNGRPLSEYYARGATYVEALDSAEYELRITNPLPERVAVALSVDGLNTIDARHTSAWNASKWVIEPYGTVTIGGWQMSSERARRFYFTSERDSYGAKLGQTSNLGVISAVFFIERRHRPIPLTRRDSTRSQDSDNEANGDKSTSSAESAKRSGGVSPRPQDDYPATGIGRSVQNDVAWTNMDLESQPTAELTIRYEYYATLVRLGIIPRQNDQGDALRRRERSRGFEDRRFSPEP